MADQFKMDCICEETDKATHSARQLWHKKYKHCLEECEKCSELQILKKMLWEMRKPTKK